MPPITLPTSPYAVADETFLIPTFASPARGTAFGAHSLVIRGAEPVIVDTGCSLVGRQWLEQAFSVVDPPTSAGSSSPTTTTITSATSMRCSTTCPNATLVASFPIFGPPHGRRRTAARTDALGRPRGRESRRGDRRLTIVRPPTFDSPATPRAHDSTTNLLWAVDAFGALIPGAMFEAGDMPPTSTNSASPISTAGTHHGSSGSTPNASRHASRTDVGSPSMSSQCTRPDPPRRPDRRCVPAHTRRSPRNPACRSRPGNARPDARRGTSPRPRPDQRN